MMITVITGIIKSGDDCGSSSGAGWSFVWHKMATIIIQLLLQVPPQKGTAAASFCKRDYQIFNQIMRTSCVASVSLQIFFAVAKSQFGRSRKLGGRPTLADAIFA